MSLTSVSTAISATPIPWVTWVRRRIGAGSAYGFLPPEGGTLPHRLLETPWGRELLERPARALALDVGRPGLLDLLDHGVGHRDVVEILGHLAALLERVLEELQRILGGRLVRRIFVDQDEGRG